MSAVAYIHYPAKEIVVSAKLYFYGTFATEAIAEKIIAEISEQYNSADGKINMQLPTGESVVLTIKFALTSEIVDTEQIFDLVQNNRSYENNFIRIEKENVAQRSFMGFGLGSNVGHWITTDNLGESTTAAHEFGHSFGLDHPDETDMRGMDTFPPMMAPRGTLVNPKYQWNPTVEAGEFGGTLKPIYRRVNAMEVAKIFEGKTFSEEGILNLGVIDNLVFDEIGNPFYWMA